MHWDIFATQTHFAVIGLCNNNFAGISMMFLRNASYGILFSMFNHTFSTIPKQDPSPLPPTTHKDVAYWLAPHLLKVNLDCELRRISLEASQSVELVGGFNPIEKY